MENNLYDKGMETLEKMVGSEILQKTVEHVKQFSPEFARLIVEVPFGTIYSRPALDLKQRCLLTISSLVTQGAESQLAFHVNAAMNVGLTPQEIVEAVMHCTVYAGFPKAIGALSVVMQVFQERNITL